MGPSVAERPTGPSDAATAPHDPERAKAALTDALEAWKQGRAKGLAKRSPPIRFSDDDFAAGLQLADYGLVEPDATVGPLQDVPVILSLRGTRGATVRRETTYQVSTSPGLAVIRSDP